MNADTVVSPDHQDALVYILQRETKEITDVAQLLFGTHKIGNIDTHPDEGDDGSTLVMLR
ncbi:hypothetical protein ASF58_22990 [Methylobacterium sp. Leaf125]|nr:hypothetical protein ASF58_22990 [Methylobacterium sp. Leaf125]